MNVAGYAITLLFIYLFYRNYVKISIIASTKQLMKDILSTRKQYNIMFYYLIMIAYSIIVGLLLLLGLVLELMH
jgi:hypothetical protein